MSIKYAVIKANTKNIFEYTDAETKFSQSTISKLIKQATQPQQVFALESNHKLFLSTEAIVSAVVCTSDMNKEKAFRFLKDIEANLIDQYYNGNITLLIQNTKLKNKQYDQTFLPTFTKILNQYKPVVDNNILKSCIDKTKRTKGILAVAIEKQLESNEIARSTQENAIEMNLLGQQFKKKSNRILEKAKEASCFGCKGRIMCIIIAFGSTALMYSAVSIAVCGNFKVLAGC